MIFTFSEPEGCLHLRYTSENQIWELGLWRVLYGVRVLAFRAGEGSIAVNYCAGSNEQFQGVLLGWVLAIFSTFPEDLQTFEAERLLPSCFLEPKPIYKSVNCCAALKYLAENPVEPIRLLEGLRGRYPKRKNI